MIHDRRGEMTLQPYGIHAYEALYSISRERLVHCLLDAAEATGKVRIRFGQKLQAVDWNAGTFSLDDAGEMRFEVLFGADGAGSRRIPAAMLARAPHSGACVAANLAKMITASVREDRSSAK